MSKMDDYILGREEDSNPIDYADLDTLEPQDG